MRAEEAFAQAGAYARWHEKRAEVERKEKKQRLLELIAQKEDQELAGKSKDELRAMVEAL